MPVGQKKYRELLAAMNDAVFVHGQTPDGKAGKFIDVNEAACHSLGYTYEELLNLSPLDIDQPSSKEAEHLHTLKEIEEKGHAIFEVNHIAKDGHEVPVEISARSFVVNGETLMVSIARDIGERKITERKLRESDARFRTLFDVSPTAIKLYDPLGNLTAANRASLEMIGVGKVGDIQHINLFRDPLIPSDAKARLIDGKKCSFGISFHFDSLRNQHKIASTKKGKFFADAVVVPLHSDEGDSLRGYLMQMQDITKSMETASQLIKRGRELTIQRQISETFLEFNDHKALDAVLKIALENLGCSCGFLGLVGEANQLTCTVINNNITETSQSEVTNALIISEDSWEGSWGTVLKEKTLLMDNRITTGEIFHTFDLQRILCIPIIHAGQLFGIITAANKPFDFEDSDQNFLEMIASYIAPILSMRLENEKKEREHKKMESHLQHTDKLASIGVMAASVTHEINNPLQVIVGNSALLKKHIAKPGLAGDDDLNAKINSIAMAADQISKIVYSLRTYSRRENATLLPIDVHESLSDACRMMEYLLNKAGVALIKRFQAKDRHILGQNGKLQQVIVNLISNAKDALEGKPGALVAIDTENPKNSSQVYIKVADNGCGMPPEIIKSIFEPFFTTKGAKQGTGLGLAITNSIITEMNGTVTVESTPNMGTTFIIKLPITDAKEKAPPEVVEKQLPTKRQATINTILIVDDEAGIRELLVELLSSAEVKVTGAENGLVAWNLIQKQHFDVIVTDNLMPQMGGYELLRHIAHSQMDLTKTKVIMMTGGIFGKEQQEGEEMAGMRPHAYLPKPFDENELIKLIQSVG